MENLVSVTEKEGVHSCLGGNPAISTTGAVSQSGNAGV